MRLRTRWKSRFSWHVRQPWPWILRRYSLKARRPQGVNLTTCGGPKTRFPVTASAGSSATFEAVTCLCCVLQSILSYVYTCYRFHLPGIKETPDTASIVSRGSKKDRSCLVGLTSAVPHSGIVRLVWNMGW